MTQPRVLSFLRMRRARDRRAYHAAMRGLLGPVREERECGCLYLHTYNGNDVVWFCVEHSVAAD